MGASEASQGIRQSRLYWDRRATEAENDCGRTEQSRRAQRMRFEAFLCHHDLRGRSVLDIGCGTGDLLDHLRRRRIDCSYLGVDLSAEMVERCRVLHPGEAFEAGNVLDWPLDRVFDYTVAFGVHAIKVDAGWELVDLFTRRQFELCRIAAHATFLTNRYMGFASHIQPWPPEDVLRLGLKITPNVALNHDFLPNSFSLTMYREPLIDRRKDLLLD